MNIKHIRQRIDTQSTNFVIATTGAMGSYLTNNQELFIFVLIAIALFLMAASFALQYHEHRRANAIRARVKAMLENRRTKAQTAS